MIENRNIVLWFGAIWLMALQAVWTSLWIDGIISFVVFQTLLLVNVLLVSNYIVRALRE